MAETEGGSRTHSTPSELPGVFAHYFEAVEQSSSRTRWITVILTIASTLAFFSYWNTLPFAWCRSRTALTQKALEYAVASESEKTAFLQGPSGEQYSRALQYLKMRGVATNTGLVRMPLVAEIQCDTLRSAQVSSTTAPEHESCRVGTRSATVHRSGQSTSRCQGHRARHSARPTEPRECDGGARDGAAQLTLVPKTIRGEAMVPISTIELLHDLERFRDLFIDDVIALDIPFLGVSCDVNDLGLVAGLAFAIILLLRWRSFAAERYAIERTLALAQGTPYQKTVYEIVALKQVLTVPRRSLADAPGTRSWKGPGAARSPKALRLLRLLWKSIDIAPLAVLTLVLGSNLATFEVGYMTSPIGAVVSIAASAALWLATGGLTIRCMMTEDDVYEVLDRHAEEVFRGETPAA